MIEMIELTCSICNKKFTRKKAQYTYDVKKAKEKGKEHIPKCSSECLKKGVPKITAPCSECGSNVNRKRHEMWKKTRKSKRMFCDSSCAAKYNNRNRTTGCRRSKLEIYLCEQIKLNFPQLEIVPSDVKTLGIELDIYLPQLRLAFELNGIVHYEPIYGQDKFEKIINKDKQKVRICEEKGIELCVIDSSKQIRFTEKSSQVYLKQVLSLIQSLLKRLQ